ncbi:hypothetical protein SZN_14838 [Streptomyces zinciresistens K42]|uniref:Uncharacterized protein n=1 Tax=Streptomyces zinciresistens K42 TaxID=700597 RepID=G2GBT0_9ACTN|nr:hypothetical protein [Streptomyces zinciresistens]EGX59034.1 hypothetical protein SZN_14838 [Streptomyces zinciresistens K42]
MSDSASAWLAALPSAGGVWSALALMAAATAAGALLARRSSGHAALILILSAGMMLITSFVDLLPEAWAESRTAGIAPWVVLLVAPAGYLVMTLFTRDGCGCDGETARAVRAHAPGRHRRLKESAGAASIGFGAATALTTHRLFEGTAVALALSLPVVLTLAVASASDGLALASLLRETRQRLAPWLAVACVSPAVGALIASVSPLPAAVLPLALAAVAGVIVRIAVIGIRLAARKRRKGQLTSWHMVTAAAATLTMGALLLSAA